MKGVVSGIACEKALKAFSLEARMVSTQAAVGVTHQAKLSTLVKGVQHYHILFPTSQKLQTPQNTSIN